MYKRKRRACPNAMHCFNIVSCVIGTVLFQSLALPPPPHPHSDPPHQPYHSLASFNLAVSIFKDKIRMKRLKKNNRYKGCFYCRIAFLNSFRKLLKRLNILNTGIYLLLFLFPYTQSLFNSEGIFNIKLFHNNYLKPNYLKPRGT